MLINLNNRVTVNFFNYICLISNIVKSVIFVKVIQLYNLLTTAQGLFSKRSNNNIGG